jgi:hypothetical protein
MYAPRLEEHSLALLVVPQQRVFKGAPASVNLVIPLCIRLRATARHRNRYGSKSRASTTPRAERQQASAVRHHDISFSLGLPKRGIQ